MVLILMETYKIRNKASIPASPSFCPHLWLVSLIWREIITIEAIASVNLRNILHLKLEVEYLGVIKDYIKNRKNRQYSHPGKRAMDNRETSLYIIPEKKMFSQKDELHLNLQEDQECHLACT